MTFDPSLLTLTPNALWVGFEIDCSLIGGTVYYLTPNLNQLDTTVIWQGIGYTAMPIMGSGFESSTQGALPHPNLQVSNLNGVLNALVNSLDDLVGATVTRVQVPVNALDAINFPGGINATADPTKGYTDVWTIEQKTAETADGITFDMVASCDAQGLTCPARQVNASRCSWQYKVNDGQTGCCSYAGALATCDHGLKTPNGCVAHFGVGNPCDFGAFPGAQQVAS